MVDGVFGKTLIKNKSVNLLYRIESFFFREGLLSLFFHGHSLVNDNKIFIFLGKSQQVRS